MATKARQPVKGINKTAADIAANALAEKERKAASRKALRDAKKAAMPPPAEEPSAPCQPDVVDADHREQDAINALVTATADAISLGVPLEEMLTTMGIDATGHPAVPDEPPSTDMGPMYALRAARLSYTKAPNGYPCCGDSLATLCGLHDRSTVITALIRAMHLEGNPYTHLNPGQQSMNLRNKARGMIKKGALDIETIRSILS
jgi:hypothetical protein